MSEAVLDASAVLAWLWDEPGGDAIEALQAAHVSSVNLAEVVQKLVDRPVDPATVQALVASLPSRTQPFGPEDAVQAGLWRGATRHRGLSVGDRACLALGKRLGLPVYTADHAWADLDLGVEVVLIR